MKTLFGKGPLIIKRTIGPQTIECIFEYHMGKKIITKLDITNKGKLNQNKERVDRLNGIWIIFDLILDDAPTAFGGTSGDNLVKFYEILRLLIPLPISEQYIELIPANSTGASDAIKCKFANDEIPIDDLSEFAGRGQLISMKLITKDLNTEFLMPYYIDPGTEEKVGDRDGNIVGDRDGHELAGR